LIMEVKVSSKFRQAFDVDLAMYYSSSSRSKTVAKPAASSAVFVTERMLDSCSSQDRDKFV
jgi:hypothetical protein